MRIRFSLLLLAVSGCYAQRFDLLIRHGHILDGTGSPWYSADIGVRDGHIAAIGSFPNATATEIIDATGLVVAPGFIDMLGQSEISILVDPRLPSKIYQGITTEITGEGSSVAPLNAQLKKELAADMARYQLAPPTWTTFSGYFDLLEKRGIGINLASYVGATQVRQLVIGEANRAPSDAELTRMKELVAASMRDGAAGLSAALQYSPAPYASTSELVELAKEASRYGGIYATHMRSESGEIMRALDETFQIAREAEIPVEIWHLKAAGKQNWGTMPQIVAKIENARKSGLDIAADTYAYTAWFNSFSAFVPPWAHAGGDGAMVARLRDGQTRARIRREMESSDSKGWDNEWQEIPNADAILISVVTNPKLRPLQGKTVAEVARERQKEPIETILDLLAEDPGMSVAVSGMSQEDVDDALKQPWVSVDNDSQGTSPTGLLAREHPHPRAYGTFPRILRRYVHDEHLLTLPDAIRKFSSLPAQRLRLADRGVLKAGLWADIVVFDPDQIRDMATFDKPNQLSVGMRYVLVNGVPVIRNGEMTGSKPGKVLRGSGAARLPLQSQSKLNVSETTQGGENGRQH